MKILALIATCLLAAGVQAGPLHLQALVPTSGEGAAAVLDGTNESGWSPAGDPGGEGLLLRFEQPEAMDRIHVQLCPGSGQFNLVPYINGTSRTARAKGADKEEFEIGLAGEGKPQQVRSVFLRVSAPEGVPCVDAVDFYRGEQKLPVAPPRAVAGAIEASSTLTPIDAYHSAYLFDGRTDFGWVEGAKGLGKGESVTVELDEPVELHALELWNGYQRSKDHFRKNARATVLEVKLDEAEPVRLRVKDAMGPQKLALPKPVLAKTIKLTIVQARRGKRYPDLVLSELRLWDASGPLTVTTEDMAERKAALEEEIAGTPLAEVVDRQWACACCQMRSTRLKLRTNHTFVWYLDAEQAGDEETRSKSEVFDGAWVVGKPKEPSAVVKLYGRRHRTSSVFNPYAGNKVRDTTRIGGGNLTITRLADIDSAQFAKLAQSWLRSPARDKVNCLDLSPDGLEATFEALVEKKAVLIQGKAITDLMIYQGR